ncbi:hypothetical protein [Candidatus Protochlamydia sp. R18]|uniref:hypothetical protein n=1 Tax=Candidatus Protochlamydia sp. R18 TaxID=1353977 RepID=UPI0005A72258|nr:hypothetical protein [Candidatus Protochlamydia sp. R18]
MKQITPFKIFLTFFISFLVYFIISYQQAAEKESQFQATQERLDKLEQQMQYLKEEIQLLNK